MIDQAGAAEQEDEIRQGDVDALDRLDDDDFRSVVARRLDTDPRNKKIWKMLCHPLLLERTLGCLEEMAADIKARQLPPVHGKVRRLNVVNKRIEMVHAAEVRVTGPPAAAAVADIVSGCPRFDAAVFYAALDARRRALGLRWCDVAVQASVSRSMLSRMGVQKLCPDVHGLARLLVWLGDTDLGPYISATAAVRRRSDGRAASERVDGVIGPGRVMTVEGLA